MESGANKTCEFGDCIARATHGNPGGIALFCARHAPASAVIIREGLCERCGATAKYGLLGQSARFCKAHAPKGAVSTKKGPICEAPGCDVTASYCDPSERRARFCAVHRPDDAIDVRSRRCETQDCRGVGRFINPGDRKHAFCTRCRTEGMVDMNRANCEFPGCPARATYKTPGARRAQRCAAHKLAEMLETKRTTPKCEAPDCPRNAKVGPLFAPHPIHCEVHRTRTDVLVRNPKCAHTGCKERPTHRAVGPEGDGGPTHCALHAPCDARAVVRALCAKCQNEAIMSTESGLCQYCEFGARYGNYRKLKETRVAGAIAADAFLAPMLTSRDRTVVEGAVCGTKQRPDFLFDRERYALVLEVDEMQHKFARNYSHDCEFARMAALHQSLGIPTFFVRYNPDEWRDSRGRQHGKGDVERDRRALEHVRDLIRAYDARDSLCDGLFVSYMFYDGHELTKPRRIDYV